MQAGSLSNVGDEQRGRLSKASDGAFRQAHYHALNAKRESESFCRRSAEHLRKAIIPAAAHNRVLRTKLVAHNLKRGAHVVVQPTYQSLINNELYAPRIEQCSECLEVSTARIT